MPRSAPAPPKPPSPSGKPLAVSENCSHTMSLSVSSLYGGDETADVASWVAGSRPPSPLSDHSIDELFDLELDQGPESDYLDRFRDRSLDSTARQDAINWMSKVHAHYRFRPATAYLAVNYLDRFLSTHTLPKGNGWPFQLLSVACLSLAAKMEETHVPLLLDFQVMEPKFVFEPRTIQRMELLIMAHLKWRLRSVTPFDFVEYFFSLYGYGFSNHLFARVADLILGTNRVIDFLGHRPSAIAAASVRCAAGGYRSWGTFCSRLCEESVIRCQQLMEEYLVDTCPSARLKLGSVSPPPPPPPESPVGVLDAASCGSCDTKSAAEIPEPSSKRRNICGDVQKW